MPLPYNKESTRLYSLHICNVQHLVTEHRPGVYSLSSNGNFTVQELNGSKQNVTGTYLNLTIETLVLVAKGFPIGVKCLLQNNWRNELVTQILSEVLRKCIFSAPNNSA